MADRKLTEEERQALRNFTENSIRVFIKLERAKTLEELQKAIKNIGKFFDKEDSYMIIVDKLDKEIQENG